MINTFDTIVNLLKVFMNIKGDSLITNSREFITETINMSSFMTGKISVCIGRSANSAKFSSSVGVTQLYKLLIKRKSIFLFLENLPKNQYRDYHLH